MFSTCIASTIFASVLTIADILSGTNDWRHEEFAGTVTDVLDDETDLSHLFLTVSEGGQEILVPISRTKDKYDEFRKLIGAEVLFKGKCDPTRQTTMRLHMGRRFDVERPTDYRVIAPAGDMFNVPDVSLLDDERPETIAGSARHRTDGRVIAVWDKNNILLLTTSNRFSRIELADDNPPAYGAAVTTVGFPETDLYHINLVRANWRPAPEIALPEENIHESSISEILEAQGKPAIRKQFFGKTLRIRGTVKGLPHSGIMPIADGGRRIVVDVSSLDSLPQKLCEGCEVEVTGACIMDIANWQPHNRFPKIKSVMIVARTPADLRIISYPPWWTTKRLAAVIGGLLVVLFGCILYGNSVRRLANRRGRELYREQLQSTKAEVKFIERNNLAVELHDAVSQYLTGIALELRTIGESANELPDDTRRHLVTATTSLASCREELKNCLWDLRHRALDERDMETAIRQTLIPHIGSASLSVRFSVPRSRFTDNSAHAVLKIVRELAVNAIRHGKATEIKVAGAMEGSVLKFSVRDNGAGFDPEKCPGMEEGHFGLLGIYERVESFNGSFDIESSPGHGTRAEVTMQIQEQDA